MPSISSLENETMGGHNYNPGLCDVGLSQNPVVPSEQRKPAIEYVVGFLFGDQGINVALIHKTKPAWQFGKLNGIGGKIEPGETAAQAMTREFREEAGVHIEDWEPFATIICDNGGNEANLSARVHFFRYFSSTDLQKVETKTEERVQIVDSRDVQIFTCVPNLRWLLPMALARGGPYLTINEEVGGLTIQ